MHQGGSAERPATFFDGAEDFRAWLETNHETATELWMGLYKKHVTERGLTWEQAVREALCFGWIDSVAQRIDEDAVRQRWTPRKPSSNWSAINIKAVEQLTAAGRMHPAGLAAFERRSPERSGIYSYEQDADRELPEHYLAMLRANSRASTFWDAATASYRKVVTHWVLTAKQEATRDKRMAELVADSAAGRLIKSQSYGTEPVWVARVRAQLG
jgi:uncharacterized protein YdeI (YjbR/CyaY-like superfamily)